MVAARCSRSGCRCSGPALASGACGLGPATKYVPVISPNVIRRALNIKTSPPPPPAPAPLRAPVPRQFPPSARRSSRDHRNPGTRRRQTSERRGPSDRPATGRPPGARPRAGARDRLTTDHTSGSAPPETHTRVARCRVPTARCAREPRVCTANPNGCARPSASLDVWRAPHRRKMVDAKLLTASSSTSFGLSCKQ